MSVPRWMASKYFYLCLLGLFLISTMVDGRFGYLNEPLTFGTPGDILFVVGVIVLIIVWPSGRVWPGLGITTDIKTVDESSKTNGRSNDRD